MLSSLTISASLSFALPLALPRYCCAVPLISMRVNSFSNCHAAVISEGVAAPAAAAAVVVENPARGSIIIHAHAAMF
jgi:hypothetical protein